MQSSDLNHVEFMVKIWRCMKFLSVTNVERTFVHPFPALWEVLALNSMRQNL